MPAGRRLARAGLDRLAHLALSGLEPEIRKDPGRAGLLPRGNRRAGGKIDNEVERSVPPCLGPKLANLLTELGQRLGPGQLDREKSIPTGRPAQGPAVGPAGGNPHRDAGRLHGRRLELAAPVGAEPVESCVEQACPLARIHDLAERLQLVVAIAAKANAEGETAAAEQVERDCLARELMDAPPRERGDQRTEANPLGVGGHRGERDPGIGDRPHRRSIAHVVPAGRTRPSRAPRRSRRAWPTSSDRPARRTERRRFRASRSPLGRYLLCAGQRCAGAPRSSSHAPALA